MFLLFSLILSKSKLILIMIMLMIMFMIGNSLIGSTHSFHSIPLRSMFIGYSMLTLFFPNPAPSFLVIDLGSNYRLTLCHHFITTQIGLTRMFQSFMLSILRMKIRNLWEIEDLNWVNRVWFNVQNRIVLYLIILSIGNDWMKSIKWMNWIVVDSLIKSLYWTIIYRMKVNDNGFHCSIHLYWMEISITNNSSWVKNKRFFGV